VAQKPAGPISTGLVMEGSGHGTLQIPSICPVTDRLSAFFTSHCKSLIGDGTYLGTFKLIMF